MSTHIPVLLEQVLRFLDPRPGGRYIDATLGGAGHAASILERTAPDGRVLGLDVDASALEVARVRLASLGSRITLEHTNFRNLIDAARCHDLMEADGVLADIGLSSMLVEDPSRGFSWMREGPLDMRMDRSRQLTAAQVVNTYGEHEIADILYRYGEERQSRRLARAIVSARPLTTTTQLARVAEAVLGRRRRGRIHPATRTFQALRIAVNDELESLRIFLESCLAPVRQGGRVVVVSFHSLEDRLVKHKFLVLGRVLTPKVVVADAREIRINPRARSARLRAVEKT